jgi:hypothetical protein
MRKWGLVVTLFFAAAVVVLLIPAAAALQEDWSTLPELPQHLGELYGFWPTWHVQAC